MNNYSIAPLLLGATEFAQAHNDPTNPAHNHAWDSVGLLMLVCLAMGAWWLAQRRK